jgi:hypothetical protein
MDNTEHKRQLLIGKENYLGWSKILKAVMITKKYFTAGHFVPAEKENAASLIFTSVSSKIAGDLPDDLGPAEMLQWLKVRFGNENRWDMESAYKETQMVNGWY